MSNSVSAPKTALTDFSDLPRFDALQVADIEPSITYLLTQAQRALEDVTAPTFPAHWTEITRVLDVQVEKLSRAWGVISHLNSVADHPEQRLAYNQMLPKVTEFWTQLGANEQLFQKYEEIKQSELNPEQRKALNNALRNFILSGAKLTGERKIRFAQIQEQQAALAQKFSENVLDATDTWFYVAQLEELEGVPQEVIDAAKEEANRHAQTGYRLSLKMPCYLPIMQYAKNADLRALLYKAYSTRASDQAPQDALQYDNSKIIKEILSLRHEEAQLLGFENFSTLSLEPKMANSPKEVIAFLRDLAAKARPFATKDLSQMRSFAKTLGIEDPAPSDWTFIAERLKEHQYAFSDLEVKAYFPFPKVLSGLFKIIETLFEVSIEPDQAAVWHKDVSFFKIVRNHQTLGQFYLDPTARQSKRGGAWMDGVRNRWLRPDSAQLQTPVAYLVCNFAKGQGDQPALLTHDDVITLFHEFGHGLHHMLTMVNEQDVSGIGGVEWDAVELPSQFMENFCWEWSVLRHMSAHHQTGEVMPRALFDKMLAAKNFQSGLQTLRQVEFSLFDMLIHSEDHEDVDFMAIQQAVKAEVALIQSPPWSRTPHSFSHIFAGGYAAGYYSYKWAEVLSADAYAAFEETMSESGELNPLMGSKFRQEILEVGGSREAMASFIAFRGREPSIEALLRHQGMLESHEGP
jgi:oligopeptidase A